MSASFAPEPSPDGVEPSSTTSSAPPFDSLFLAAPRQIYPTRDLLIDPPCVHEPTSRTLEASRTVLLVDASFRMTSLYLPLPLSILAALAPPSPLDAKQMVLSSIVMMDVSFSEIEAQLQDWVDELIRTLSRALGIPESLIFIISVLPGSVAVDFSIEQQHRSASNNDNDESALLLLVESVRDIATTKEIRESYGESHRRDAAFSSSFLVVFYRSIPPAPS